MLLKRRRLFEDPLVAPSKFPEVNRQRNGRQSSGCRRAAAHPQWDRVVHSDCQWNYAAPVFFEQLLVDPQNQVVLEPRTTLCVAARGKDRELSGGLSFHVEKELQRHRRGIESRTQIRRSRRQSQAQRSGLHSGVQIAHAIPLTAAITASGVASSEIAFRRRP